MGDDKINRAVREVFGHFVSSGKIDALKDALRREGLAIVERNNLDPVSARDLDHG